MVTCVYITLGHAQDFQPEPTNPEIKRLRLSLNAGKGYRLGRLPDVAPELEDYARQLKWGNSVDATFVYYFHQKLGVGLQYNLFNTFNQANMVFFEEDGTVVSGIVQDQIFMHYIAPCFSSRWVSDNKRHILTYGVSMGYMRYVNNASYFGYIKFQANTFETSYKLEYDLQVHKDFSIGAFIALFTGRIWKYTYSDGRNTFLVQLPNDTQESTARLEAGIGIRFNE